MSVVFRQSSQITRLTVYRLLLVLSLLLAQSAALLHAQNHALAPGSNICDSCLSTQSQDSGLLPVVHSQPLPTCPISYIDGTEHLAVPTPAAHTYRSRAPPAA